MNLTVNEEYILRGSDNKIPKRTFGPKRHEVTGQWGKERNEEARRPPPTMRKISINFMRPPYCF